MMNVMDTMPISHTKEALTPEMKAYLELKHLLVSVQEELDYDKELAEARQEKYGYTDWHE